MIRLIVRGLRAGLPSGKLICILTGCATTRDSSATNAPAGLADVKSVACGAFQPITWSSRDTDPTIRQVKLHNVSYASLCGTPGSPGAAK